MKKFTFLLAVLFVLNSCTKDYGEEILQEYDSQVEMSNDSNHHITIDEALENLFSFLDFMSEEIPTRSNDRNVGEIQIVTLPQPQTRSDNPYSIPDTLLYIVNTSDNSGYSILSADNRVTPVLGITGNLYSGSGNIIAQVQQRAPAVTIPYGYEQNIDNYSDYMYDDPNEWLDEVDDFETPLKYIQSESELLAFITDFATGYSVESIVSYEQSRIIGTRATLPDWNWNGVTWVTTEYISPLVKTV